MGHGEYEAQPPDFLVAIPGLLGEGSAEGVRGQSHTSWAGVAGYNDSTGPGVYGKGTTGGSFEGTFEGVHVVSHHPSAAGVAGYNDNTGPGVYGKSTGGGAAGYFDGNVVITGSLTLQGMAVATLLQVIQQLEQRVAGLEGRVAGLHP